MKKGIAILLCALMLMLCACVADQPKDTKPTEPSTVGTTGDTTPSTEPTPAATQPSENKEKLEKAQSCIGKSVQELYALIGEPVSSDYASSCLGEGDDGNLYYDGFVVYTYREGDTETVRYVSEEEI